MNRKKIVKEILGWVRCLLLAFVLGLIINNAVIANAVVISPSMENTIMTDSRVMGLRVTYYVSDPKRFDIILFTPPDDESSVPYVKRVIGLPNEIVKILNGKVYINDSDEPLDDSFIKEEARGNYGPFFVPENSYFVLGDNRNNSHDSKNWTNKYVSKDMILGRVYILDVPARAYLFYQAALYHIGKGVFNGVRANVGQDVTDLLF